jgi:NAD(P)-dependent dehydrogenase (short-subunit alcohol dehydrogenase family)
MISFMNDPNELRGGRALVRLERKSGIVVNISGADVVRAHFTKAFGITPEAVTAAIPLRRMGVPQDIAEVAGFLISDRAAWITGSNFIVDGGQHPAV